MAESFFLCDRLLAKVALKNYRVTFLTGPALKVLSVGDGKIPTKKVKVRVSHRENMKF